VIATGFEGGGIYVPQRQHHNALLETPTRENSPIVDSSGVRIPSFLLNRQHRSNEG
jgi:hypothetical protein